ncbi:PJA2 ligase, partial [Formicarius rufipectus]|nr:PJA2 ligase [Formicarius rufipectus]
MGQGGGKTVWPKSAGGYTFMHRRCGKRHGFLGFRPLFGSQGRGAHEHNEDCKQLESKDVHKENSICTSRSLVQVSSALVDEPLSENAGTREPTCQNESSQAPKANTPPFSVVCNGPEGNQISQNFTNPDENGEEFAVYTSEGCNDLNGKNGIGFVNIDSYEPDSSDGEEDDGQDKYPWLREAAGVIRGKLDNVLSQYEKEVESFIDLQSQLSTLNHGVSREGCEEAGSMPLVCPNNRTFKSTEDQTILKNNLSGTSCETPQIKHIVGVGIGTPVPVADVLNVSDGKPDQENSSEPVVRPKIRKASTANQLEREERLPNDDEEESGSWKRTLIADVQQCHPECPLRDREEMSSGAFFLARIYGDEKNTERDLRKNAAVQNQKNVQDDSAFGDELEHCNRHYFISHKNEDSSECSDGEWATAVPACLTATEQEQSSSDESCETVPGREEYELQSNIGSVKEETTNFCFQEGGYGSILLADFLEEGEFCCLQYREEVESSSDEENYPIHDFLHPGFFLLSENNLDDDSSVSEDLDVDWRVLEEFGDGLGLAQNIPYVEPQLLTFMALEGRLEAVETALAQLESLAFDVEQTHPPAARETIDCLPMILFTGPEQCCTICCSEYMRGEYVAELPCHHLFHKSCVTLWLQRSGTCPVCRHVLAPVCPEAAVDT